MIISFLYQQKSINSTGTDINKAVLNGIDQLKVSKQEGERSPTVVFLTDGHPTSGEQNDMQILKNIDNANEGGTFITVLLKLKKNIVLIPPDDKL